MRRPDITMPPLTRTNNDVVKSIPTFGKQDEKYLAWFFVSPVCALASHKLIERAGGIVRACGRVLAARRRVIRRIGDFLPKQTRENYDAPRLSVAAEMNEARRLQSQRQASIPHDGQPHVARSSTFASN